MPAQRNLLIAALFLSAVLLLQCSDDDKPTAPGPDLSAWGGILMVDNQGTVIGGDESDWCSSANPGRGGLPEAYALYPAYPNPAVDSIRIRYDLPAASSVTLQIMDSTGAILRTLVDADQVAGSYSVSWPLDDSSGIRLSPGLYRCLMTAGGFSCRGDLEIASPARQVTVYGIHIGDALKGVYVSPVDVGGLVMRFLDPDTVGAVLYTSTTNQMVTLDSVKTDTLIVAILPDVADLHSMPAGTQILFRTTVSGTARLIAVDASDTLGYILPGLIREATF